MGILARELHRIVLCGAFDPAQLKPYQNDESNSIYPQTAAKWSIRFAFQLAVQSFCARAVFNSKFLGDDCRPREDVWECEVV